MKDYGLEKNRAYRYVLVIIDNFSKFGWIVPLKKNAITIEESLKNFLRSSKRKPKLIESDRGKEIYNNIFQNILNNSNIKHYSRKSLFASVFAERFNRSLRDLLKRLVYEKGDGKWVDVLSTITKQHNNRIHSSTKLTRIQASLKKVMFTIFC